MTETSAAHVTAEVAFRHLMASFPTGVAVVTAPAEDGPRGMTCSSLTSVCLKPATLAVCLHTASSTRAAALRHGRFAINLLNAGAEHAARVFSTDVPDRFALVGWRDSGTGLALLVDDACAYAECSVRDSVEVGDHTMMFGTVTDSRVLPVAPLVYARQSFRCWDALPTPQEHRRKGDLL